MDSKYYIVTENLQHSYLIKGDILIYVDTFKDNEHWPIELKMVYSLDMKKHINIENKCVSLQEFKKHLKEVKITKMLKILYGK